jgi:hypothetical protein
MSSAEAELETEKGHAEALLMELAADLRYVPVEEATRVLHTRALQLKGAVAVWSVNAPDESTRQSTCQEILALQHEAREFRTRLRSGAQLARASG